MGSGGWFSRAAMPSYGGDHHGPRTARTPWIKPLGLRSLLPSLPPAIHALGEPGPAHEVEDQVGSSDVQLHEVGAHPAWQALLKAGEMAGSMRPKSTIVSN